MIDATLLARLFQLIASQMDIGQQTQFSDTLVKQATIDIDFRKLVMSAWVLWCKAHHFVQNAHSTLCLAAIAVVPCEVVIFLQRATDILS